MDYDRVHISKSVRIMVIRQVSLVSNHEASKFPVFDFRIGVPTVALFEYTTHFVYTEHYLLLYNVFVQRFNECKLAFPDS